MTGSAAVPSGIPATSATPSAIADAREPVLALLAGGIAAALAFELSAYFVGATLGVVVAGAGAIAAVMRRAYPSAALFVIAAIISLLALDLTAVVLPVAAGAFGIGLALLARATIGASIGD